MGNNPSILNPLASLRVRLGMRWDGINTSLVFGVSTLFSESMPSTMECSFKIVDRNHGNTPRILSENPSIERKATQIPEVEGCKPSCTIIGTGVFKPENGHLALLVDDWESQR